MEYFNLKSKTAIPAIGFGPDEMGYSPRRRQIHSDIVHRGLRKIKRITVDEPKYVNCVQSAFECGFRLLDWSAAYGNGELLSRAIKKAGVKREEMMITTRVSNKAQFNKTVREEFLAQLKGFDTDYIDILMFHWPVTGCYEATWEEMLKLKEEGYCRILGVANCHEKHLERLKSVGGVFPELNQVEIHPLFTQIPLRNYCKNNGIQVEAYSPTARHDDRLFNPPLVRNIAKRYKKTPTQIILRWHIQNGIIPIIRSLNTKHQIEDISVFDFVISDDDMKKIDSLNINARIRYDPDNCDFSCL